MSEMKLKPPKAHPHQRAHALALAGLLHDVGKVSAAAGSPLPAEYRENNERLVCPPAAHGRYSHVHALYTDWLLDRAPVSAEGLPAEELRKLAARHHNPDASSLDQILVQKADRVASGHDREAEDEDRQPRKVIGLTPPLQELVWPQTQVEDRTTPTERVLPAGKLSLDERDYLPAVGVGERKLPDACALLAEELVADLQQLVTFAAGGGPGDRVDQLLSILQRRLHAVPASRARQHEPDVNLFDHSRLVAAFAACLAVQHERGPAEVTGIRGGYLLVELAFGGIQSFITRGVPTMNPPESEGSTETVEKGAAKRLRARSFYVGLLSWLAARRILDACGMPPVNLIHDVGGRALLMLPTGGRTEAALGEAIGYLRYWVHLHLANTLRLDVAVSAPLDDASFEQANFQQTLRDLDERLAAARFENPWPHNRGNESWAGDGWVGDGVALPIDRGPFLTALKELGKKLPKATHLYLVDDDGVANPHQGEVDIFGYRISLDHEQRRSTSKRFALGISEVEPHDGLLLTATHLPLNEGDAAERLGGNSDQQDGPEEVDQASSAGEPLTFTEIASLATDFDGKPNRHAMLGVLKADVDHLGMLFGYGLRKRASFGRYAGAARYLDTFFKGFLMDRLRKEFPNIYAVFAGGDDLFLIGPWCDMARFAHKLNAWFTRAAAGNGCVHLSAGLVFAKPTTPVSRLADEADAAEKLAKQQGRNRIAYGRVVLEWPDYDDALALHKTMLQAHSDTEGDKGFNASMAYRLLQYSRKALGLDLREGQVAPGPADLKWRSQMSYDLARNMPLGEDPPEAVKLLHQKLNQVLSSRDAARLYVAASLTLYHLRGAK